MNRPQFISFAGIDHQTDLSRAEMLAKRYPIEWGVLASISKCGRQNRYPDLGLIYEKLRYYTAMQIAIHLCGELAKTFNAGVMVPWLRIYDRIQVNLPEASYNYGQLEYWSDILDKPIISQWRAAEFPESDYADMHYLFDMSGGRGVPPELSKLPKQRDKSILVGYAGGITPDNVVEFNAAVQATNYYLDMESGVRTDDWLDLDKCEAVCRAIYGERP